LGSSIPLVLLSGMAADERLFAAQRAAFPNLRVQPWVPPLTGETLRAYAKRLAPRIDPGEPFVVGGASFGGVVALEVARHTPALACILIGSFRSPPALPWRWRALGPVAAFGPDTMRTLAALAARFGRGLLAEATVRRLRRLARADAEFVRWAMCAAVTWRPSAPPRRVNVFQIHGSADRVRPVARARPDVVVPGGAHALSLFNPVAVNAFVADVLNAVEQIRSHTGSRGLLSVCSRPP
jgi:pimeloyl-ACP methyl ester carboxylesterase